MEQELGSKVLGVSSSQGAIYNKNGIDLVAAEAFYRTNGGLKGFNGADFMTNEELLIQDCDILIPSALEKAVTNANANKIKAKILIEGANDCTEADADQILNERGVFVVPDILANAGGVVVSYFEWVQNLDSHYWELSKVRSELERIMVSAYNRVSAHANEHHLSMRASAYIVAIERIARAMQLRGI
jgi:glutamate dehydrogenase/leucine dehydrogenase